MTKNERQGNPSRLWIIGGVLALILITGLVFRFISGGETEDQAWEQAQATGVLRVGMDAAYPPFEYLNEQNEIIGFDIDLARAIGDYLGLEIRFENMAYDGLYDSLLIGQVDLLISALVAAPEFEGKAYFSIPYFNIGERLLVLEDSPVQSMNDLENRTLAVEYGSGGDVLAREWEGRLDNLTIQRHDQPDFAVGAVLNGEADSALVDGITARLSTGVHPDLKSVQNVEDILLAVAVSKDTPILLEQVDNALWHLFEDGTIEELTIKWFGEEK